MKVRVAQPHLVVVKCPVRVRDEGRDVRGGGDELDQLRMEKRKLYEDNLRRQRTNMGIWAQYALFWNFPRFLGAETIIFSQLSKQLQNKKKLS